MLSPSIHHVHAVHPVHLVHVHAIHPAHTIHVVPAIHPTQRPAPVYETY